MNRKRPSRLATVFTSATLALMLLGVGSVAAANPTWRIDIVRLPVTVNAGHDAGYLVTITNDGPSNINDLSVTVRALDNLTAGPSYLSTFAFNFAGAADCISQVPLKCNLGTFGDDASVSFTVAYPVLAGTTGTFDLEVSIRSGSGDTSSDGTKGKSRGDAKTVTSSTGINSSTNIDAGFVVDDLLYETTGSLGRGNKQTSSALVSDTHLTVTVEDGSGVVAPTCTDDACAGAFGEWTYLSVPGSTGLIKATLNIWGGSVPGGVSTDGIYLIHVHDGITDVIGEDGGERCTPTTGTPTNPECITVTKIGNNYRIVAWLFGNGNLRGGY